MHMKTNTVVLGGAAALVVGAGIALATPIVGLLSPLLSVGTSNSELHARGSAMTSAGERFHVELETEGPSTVSIQEGAYAAGGANGWHSHPGMVIVTVISGSIIWYDENCNPTTYKAGDSWVEGSQLHGFKVTTATTLTATFITAQGKALRTDQPAPACAAGLGL
jgi:quercetin dioxygenase-like cupin family protein